jgi:4,5:9,10-diseco-3-hydroxy-5,9,17-trioxoandrosta-1(10),2-diene-4-oate hydrolase
MTTLRTAVGVSDPWRETSVDGVRLAFSDEGRGAAPALVCLHAIGHGGSDFDRLRARWRDRRRVLTLDWPGQGRSGSDRKPSSAARYERLLAGFLDTVGVDHVVLVGNSIGGAAALRLAAHFRERVAGLVLENPGGLDRNDDRAARVALAMMARFFAAGARGARWFPAAYALYYRTVLPRSAAAAQRRKIVAAGRELAPLLLEAWRSFAARDADTRPLAAQARCPVLVAWATRDRFVQLRRARPTIATFPHARLVTFRAGHAPHLETPDAFEAELERFLALVDARVADAGNDERATAAR